VTPAVSATKDLDDRMYERFRVDPVFTTTSQTMSRIPRVRNGMTSWSLA